MRTKHRLILIEGLCGTGKTTLAERLNDYLMQQGQRSRLYDEGAEQHPVSLNGHAFYREAAYLNLLSRFSSLSPVIHSLAMEDNQKYLIPYRGITEFREVNELYEELSSNELCWTNTPRATFAEFTSLIQRHWGRFADASMDSEDIYVLEAVFLQHQIHDLLKHYQADSQQIQAHIQAIASQLTGLNPILIYLSQPDVRKQQLWISDIRDKPHFATEANIAFMERRKALESTIIASLPFPAFIIENTALEWDSVLHEMIDLVR
ncbi:hypothetical protein [Paenibacillus daejeonensis]|uniref:hypothetical protein n=1 Tax=Paenibacillus daejeonensis TaxID=135193 RepID=UPI00037CA3FF|nr:hypothetical protein [Paenibacillus daejeonensis]